MAQALFLMWRRKTSVDRLDSVFARVIAFLQNFVRLLCILWCTRLQDGICLAFDCLLSENFDKSLRGFEETFVIHDAPAHFVLERAGL